jgi:cellulose synthase/poly-beta-1,6-N-acetylglucosamine synthase-like glycosyltransferase
MAMASIASVLVLCGFILYVLFFYPMILGSLASRRARPIRRASFHPSVSLVIAVRNGERYIREKLESILALDYPRHLMEIIVVSDGSTDRTDEIASSFASQSVRLLRVPPGGKSAALNAGIAAASGEILVLTDVRQQLARDSLALLMQNFADPEVGAASAELVIRKGATEAECQTGLYWKYEFGIRVKLSAIDSIFGATGAYYGLRRELAVPIPREALLDDMYLPLAAFFRGYRLVVDPRARMFDQPTGLKSEFRRKVRTLAGNYQIIRWYPAILTRSNRMLFHFASYKLARLLLPFAMLGVLIASFGLPAPWGGVMIAAQVVFYGTALADMFVPESRLKKLTSPVATFVTLMAAAFCAVSVFVMPSAKLWKPTRVSPAQPESE